MKTPKIKNGITIQSILNDKQVSELLTIMDENPKAVINYIKDLVECLKLKDIEIKELQKEKKDLIEWAVHNKIVLSKHSLVATGTTGKLIEEALDQPVVKLLSGPLGGDQQIGSMIATGDIDMVFFFFDPPFFLADD